MEIDIFTTAQHCNLADFLALKIQSIHISSINKIAFFQYYLRQNWQSLFPQNMVYTIQNPKLFLNI